MKTTRINNYTLTTAICCLSMALSLFVTSCGAPDPNAQKRMDADIMSAGQKKGPGSTTGPQYMQGSRGYGLGGF
ncbi:hypothetical protein NT6N_10720 [Oceaniferula spumae]|uniref:Lipoprotein n=1 Tax=Oceaniferula spumae TaxID=2979115 RepID=A0AAT9FJB4_9BACT